MRSHGSSLPTGEIARTLQALTSSNLYSPLLSQQMCTQCYTYFSRPAPPLSVPCPYCPLAHFCNRLCLSKARSSASHHELLCPSQNPGCKELLEYINQQGNRPVEAVARIVAKWRGEREWSGEGEAKKVEERVWKGMARVNQEKKESERKEWCVRMPYSAEFDQQEPYSYLSR